MFGTTWKLRNLIFSVTKEIQINFCLCYLALVNCYNCDNCTPKMSVIENKACNNCTPKLNIAYVGM